MQSGTRSNFPFHRGPGEPNTLRDRGQEEGNRGAGGHRTTGQRFFRCTAGAAGPAPQRFFRATVWVRRSHISRQVPVHTFAPGGGPCPRLAVTRFLGRVDAPTFRTPKRERGRGALMWPGRRKRWNEHPIQCFSVNRAAGPTFAERGHGGLICANVGASPLSEDTQGPRPNISCRTTEKGGRSHNCI
jgi:hypothetical protein